MRKIEIEGKEASLHWVHTYVNKRKDIISTEFIIRFPESFRTHSDFQSYFVKNKLYIVLRDIIMSLVEDQLDNYNYRFTDGDTREFTPSLEYNRGHKEKQMSVKFSSAFTTDLQLLRKRLDTIEADCNCVQYEWGMRVKS